MKSTTERRGGARKAAAFTLWYQRPGREEWLGGWAMNISSGGLAALVPPEASPHIGEVVRIVLMALPSPAASDAVPVRLPPAGRVVRLDPHDGLTRRIAIAFDAAETAADGVSAEATNAETEAMSMAGIAYGAHATAAGAPALA